MRRRTGITLGAIAGLLIGGGVFARSIVRTGRGRVLACPSGWSTAAAVPAPDADVMLACEPTPADTHATPAYFALYRTDGIASDPATQNAAVLAVGQARHVFGSTLPAGTPIESSPEGGAFAVISRDVDRAPVPLITDVYFVSGGRKFGLLSIVHAPGAPFARPENTARWLDTLQGTAPWGAPNAAAFTASCPDGFETLAATAPRSVVRCAYGPASSWFVTLSLTWDEGDFGRDEDRARVASALANRVASAQSQAQGAARVTVAPEPFTLAHNVDALHARVETDQPAPVDVRVAAMYANAGVPDVLAVGIAEPDVALTATVRELFREQRFLVRRRFFDVPLHAALLALALIAVLGLTGALATRPRSLPPS